MIVVLEFVVGVGVGLLLFAIEGIDQQATAFCAQQAHARVSQMRAEADTRVWDVYAKWGPVMGPQAQALYRQRLGL